jgi:hypothetical protein
MEIIKISDNLKELTKQDIDKIAHQLAEPVIETGQISAIEAFVKLRNAKEAIDIALRFIQDTLDSEIATYGKEVPVVGNWQVQKVSGGFTYDFTNNPEYMKLKEQMKAIEEDMKAAAKSRHAMVDEATGEVIIPAIMKPKADSFKLIYKPKNLQQ